MFNSPAGLPAPKAAPALSGAPEDRTAGFGALKTPIFWIILLAFLPALFVFAGLPPHFADIAQDFGFQSGAAALVVSVFSLSSGAGSLFGGWLCDRLEHWLVYILMSTILIAALVVLSFGPALAVTLPAAGAFGFASGALLPWGAAVVARRFGAAAFGRVYGLVVPFVVIATFFPVVAAWVREAGGSYQPVFLMFAALLGVGAMAMPLLARSSVRAVAPR
jgi:MFS family permease